MTFTSSPKPRQTARKIAALTAVGLVSSAVVAPSASAQSALHSLPGVDRIENLFGSNKATNTRTLTITPSDRLSDGTTVTVRGTGYPAGESIYLAQTIEQPHGSYPDNYADESAAKVTVGADGTFEEQMTVTEGFNDIDCTTEQCFIASFTAFPKLADRSNDQWIPISFNTSATTAPSNPPSAPTVTNPESAQGAQEAADSAQESARGQELTSESTSGAKVSLSKTENLAPSGDTITVTGSGFKSSGQGIYVGLAQNDQADFANADSFSPDTVWVSKSKGNMNSDGSFSVSLPVRAQFGSANCLENACSVFTMAAHGSSDRSQDTATAVSFSGGVGKQEASLPTASTNQSNASPSANPSTSSSTSTGSDSGSSAPASSSSNGSASVQLSTTELAPEGTTPITVTGTGFKTTGNGVYVVVGERAKYSTTNAENFSAQTWIEPSMMSDDGSWSTTLNVDPATAAANCLKNQCALFTFAAHGSSDRSQDTATDLTIAGSAADKAAAAKKAESKIAQAKDQEKKDKTANRGTGSASASTDDGTEQSFAQASTNQQLNPLFSGAIGAIVGAALFGAGAWFGRRKLADRTAADHDTDISGNQHR